MKKTTVLTFIILSFLQMSCNDDKMVNTMLSGDVEVQAGDTVPFYISEISPNPFNPSTSIYFRVAHDMYLTLKVYTEDWQEAKVIIDGIQQAGPYIARFDANGMASGVYYCVMEGEGYSQIVAIRLLK
jgi:hypothetical protein